MNTAQRLANWLAENFRPLFVLLLIGFLLTWNLTMQNAYLVKTPLLPYGTFSWELNLDLAVRDSVLTTWSKSIDCIRVIKKDHVQVVVLTGRQVALDENNADYGFIFFYTGLLILFVFKLRSFTWKQKYFGVSLILIAGMLGVLENIGSYRAINDFPVHHPVFFIALPAIIKSLLLLFIVGRLALKAFALGKPGVWLKQATISIAALLKYTWRFRIVLITLILFVLILFLSDQGQDLLITINSDLDAYALFLASVTLLALLSWHLPKALDSAKQVPFSAFWLGPVDFLPKAGKDAGERPGSKVDIGRLLGAAAFLVPALGILHTMKVYEIYYELQNISPAVMFIALIGFYTIVLQHHWIDHFYKRGNTLHWPRFLITMVLVACTLVFHSVNFVNRGPYYLAYLSLDLILLSAAFLIMTTLRTCVPAIEKFQLAPWITFSAVLGFIIFIAANFSRFLDPLTSHERFYTIVIVFFAVAGYLLLSAYLMFVGKKTGVTIITFLIAIAVFVSIRTVSTYHNATVITSEQVPQRDTLTSYARAWLLNRHDEMSSFLTSHQGKDYPVFFVNAYGGGIRATVWATMVIGELDSLSLSQGPKSFRHFIFSMSGASGGTIGLAIVSAAKDPKLLYPHNFKNIYAHDYLTADVTALLGRDMLASVLGLQSPWRDRGRLMEKDWERHLCDQGIHFGNPLSGYWKKGSYESPLFFSNTYDVDDAKKGIAAPVILNELDFPSAILISQKLQRNDDLPLSTAAFLSARFPFVSPTGKLYGKHHFTDGGTWDNSGGETSQQVMQVFVRELEKLAAQNPGDSIYRHIKLSFLSIPTGIREVELRGEDKNLFEPLAPLLGILTTVGGHADKSDSTNYAMAKRDCLTYSYYNIRPIREDLVANNHIAPVLPLGWQISDYGLQEMAASAVSIKQKQFDIIMDAIGLKPRK